MLLLTALGIPLLGMVLHTAPGERVAIFVHNQRVQTLSLVQTARIVVSGHLGPVAVEVDHGRARLRESASSRLIGVRTGWIRQAGAVAACLPCGVFIQIEGDASLSAAAPDDFDALAH
jgi:hypothetical protein